MSEEAGKAIFGNFDTLQMVNAKPWQPNPLEVKISATVIEGEKAAKRPKTTANGKQKQ
jgi:hypothetical protein